MIMAETKTITTKAPTIKGNADIAALLKGRELIVEFVGPPGCGKTTNCQSFIDRCREINLHVYTFTDVKAHLYQLPLAQRIRIYLATLLRKSHILLLYSWLLASHGILSMDSIYRYVKLCIFNDAVRGFMQSRRCDMLLLDQWAIQGLWSATIFKAGPLEALQSKLKKFYFKSDVIVFFDIDAETASGRIGSRHSNLSRFDRMNDHERLARLRQYNQYLFQLYANSDCRRKLSLSGNLQPDENAERFLYHLQNTLSTE